MEIKECTEEYWDIFVDASPQGTVFNKSYFLKSYSLPVKYLLCRKGDEEVAGFAYVESENGIKAMPFLVYNGMIFKDFNEVTQYRTNETVFQALETLAVYLFDHYPEINFSNHWEVIDMRPFDWVNYHQREKGHYQIFSRYTSLLDISNPACTDAWAHKRRVPELKKGIKEGHRFETRQTDDIDMLNDFVGMNFTRQNLTRSKEEEVYLENICRSLVGHHCAKLLATYVDGEPAVITCFIYDKKRAYYFCNGTNVKMRDLGVGTKNMYEGCMKIHQEQGLNELDMVGVNSPLRGSYKLSFGGRLVLYFHVKKAASPAGKVF